MKKRVLHFITAITMAFAFLFTMPACSLEFFFGHTHVPVAVEAVEPTYISAGYTAGTRCEICGIAMDGCELIPVKPYDEFVPRLGNSAYGYYDFLNGQNAKEKQKFYLQMYTACDAFYLSTADVKAEEAQFSDGTEVTYYAAEEIDISDSKLSNDEILYIWQMFYVENPLYYWLANNSMIISKTSSVHEISKIFVLAIDENYAKYSQRAQINADISDMAEECSERFTEGMTKADKAESIHDFIAERISYAYKADGKTPEDAIWAHNMAGASSMGKGVCETYAKTYLYLCLINDINCMIVTGDGFSGTAWEEHAWNYIEIDGNWYGVDVTWDDGVNIRNKYMGAPKDVMDADHKSEKSYYNRLPELSGKAL